MIPLRYQDIYSFKSCYFLPQVGNNIKGDVRKLRKDFPEGDVVNFSELTSLTSRPTSQRRLADLGRPCDDGVRQVPRQDVAGGALADWTKDSFSAAELKYATSDTWGSLFVWQILEQRKVGIVPSAGAGQPTHEGGTDESAGSPSEGPESSGVPLESENGEGQQEEGGRGLWNLPEDVREEMEAGGAMGRMSHEEGGDEGLPEHDDEDVHEMPAEVRPTWYTIKSSTALLHACQMYVRFVH